MSDRKPADEAAVADAEPFLERWSRRKARARTGMPEDEVPAPDAPPPATVDAGSQPPAAPELPDIDELGEDSDYSAFLAPGVDELLRRRALRKLFRSPKFNVCDGLDDYCEDFTTFESLGSIVTADMRHQLERAARAAERTLEGEPAAGERDVAAAPGEPEATRAAVGESPDDALPETEDPTERHDDPDKPA